MSDFFRKTADVVLKELNATEKGLTIEEAGKRLNQYGYNELAEGKRKTTLEVFFGQFKDFLVIILIVAALISAFLGELESTIVIAVVVILNAILGTVQHQKAEQSLNSLKALSSPTAKVLRNGGRVEIPSREVTVGDIMYLDAGDFISADGRIIENHSLQINESSLTGESLSVLKEVGPINEEEVSLGDKKNMVFSGSFVTYGRGVIVVTNTGMNTEIGKIANLLETAGEKKTPLQATLDQFGKKLAIGIIIIALIIFGIDLIRGNEIIDSFMFAVALAVAAIPEALSSIVTIVLAFGTQKMAKENAIVRKLHAVESLGSISVICSDKTGTLTQNKMTVQKVYVDNRVIEEEQLDLDNPIEKRLLLMGLLCNDSITTEKKEIGDPTEVALVNFGEKYQLDELKIREEYPRLDELPFDSDRKLMSTVIKYEGKNYLVTKGALDVLLSRIVKIVDAHEISNITDQHKKQIAKINQDFSQNGLRVLGFAYKEVPEGKSVGFEDEKDLTFVGLISMMDPPREESYDAVAACIAAGIKPVMITGDHKITAAAIAKDIGILKDLSEAVEGSEIEKWSDEKLKDKVKDLSVYARVSPEHKIRIVRAWQENGNVVAMTGDGVNDGPALKQADIGVAMGITGTEVAKEASSMVLTDDNFSTIVKAISNGRSIYNNIQNSIRFLLSGNTGAVLSVLYASILALPVPFAAVHLLFINLVTDSLPAIAIGLEPHSKNIMKEKPRDVKVPLLNKVFIRRVLVEGILIALATLTAYHIGLNTGEHLVATTMAFSTLCLARLFHGFNARSKYSVFKIGLFSNKYLWYALIIGVVLLHLILLLPPLMELFEVAELTGAQFATIYGLALLPFIVLQLYKLIVVK
ncbi:calcium-translocating P-type ATPase, PMCA-type [Mesobacillus maritimus]|uniref:calcium-translocating P-type ATPase, PMCA-type n=1 Tax=Mesobacillus maritimus TaxID=1643336 RepID=UPI00203C1035|nr:calcium-translocating P-type ATPase, PMCA-type [Mesobacillus maritimus]MCM3585593.1 calcium-translocating P-type ATPase, PMCA-type [Mesobacillus maritimus]MCM3669065.1 calcium-translocating P-type ATPase, PMCA-type [Mesobacillus maritimus]